MDARDCCFQVADYVWIKIFDIISDGGFILISALFTFQ